MSDAQKTLIDHACDRLWWLMCLRRMWSMTDNLPPEDASIELPIAKEEFVNAVASFMLKLARKERFDERDSFFIATAIILAIEGQEVPEILFTNIEKETADWLRPFCCRGNLWENLNATRAEFELAAHGEDWNAKSEMNS